MMKKLSLIISLILSLISPLYAAMEDDPVLTKLMINELEMSDGRGDPLTLDGQMWIGKDLKKFWLKVEAEQVDGVTEETELQFLYSLAIAPYWDLQMGVRRDVVDGVTQNWAVIGFEGLAPYFFEIDAALFLAEAGQAAVRVNAEYELLFTQRLILSPEIEVTVYADDDNARGIGSGLSNIETGLRLRYEIKREFAPYIGVTWSNKFSGTADLAAVNGQASRSSVFVIGLKAWF